MQETWVQSLGWEDPLEKGKTIHSSIMAWRIPWIIAHGIVKSEMTEQLSLSLVFGPTGPLNSPWEGLSLYLNVLGSHVSLSWPSTCSGKLKALAGLLYWKQYLSWLLRQLVLHALEFCGSVTFSPKVFLASGSDIHTSKVNFYCCKSLIQFCFWSLRHDAPSRFQLYTLFLRTSTADDTVNTHSQFIILSHWF